MAGTRGGRGHGRHPPADQVPERGQPTLHRSTQRRGKQELHRSAGWGGTGSAAGPDDTRAGRLCPPAPPRAGDGTAGTPGESSATTTPGSPERGMGHPPSRRLSRQPHRPSGAWRVPRAFKGRTHDVLLLFAPLWTNEVLVAVTTPPMNSMVHPRGPSRECRSLPFFVAAWLSAQFRFKQWPHNWFLAKQVSGFIDIPMQE